MGGVNLGGCLIQILGVDISMCPQNINLRTCVKLLVISMRKNAKGEGLGE